VVPESYRSSVHIAADPDQVFEYFTRPEAIVRWMGDYAVLDPRPGGEFALDIEGVPVRGRYLELHPPRRLVVSWGHAGSERLPPGASTVEIVLTKEREGTTVQIVHRHLSQIDARPTSVGRPPARLVIVAAIRARLRDLLRRDQVPREPRPANAASVQYRWPGINSRYRRWPEPAPAYGSCHSSTIAG
jgi:uncharacterized protein YndB with AHSA1/START domain